MSIPAEAQDAINKAGEDTKAFMETFTKAYLEAFVKLKVDGVINDVASTALPGAPSLSIDGSMAEEGGDDSGGDSGGDLEEKKDAEVMAAGVALVNFKLLTGPDKAPHRYYNIAGVAVKPEDSVISRVTRTHRMLSTQAGAFLKMQNAPKVAFPKKKFGKKADEYYKTRFAGMEEFYEAINKSGVSQSDEFLKAFELKYDPDRAERLEVFYSALEPVAEEKGIDLESSMERAEEIGIDTIEPELLKILAVESIAAPQSETVKNAIDGAVPGFLPQKVKNRVVKMGDTSLNTVVATAIDASWGALGATFETVSKGIGAALDQGLEPIKNVMMKAAEPLGKTIKDKFKISDEEPEPSTGNEIHLDKYPWLSDLKQGMTSGKVSDALAKLEKQVGGFKNKPDYAGYLTYDFGPDWVKDLELPYVDEVTTPHEHLVGALLDAWAVLSLAGVKSLKPLFKYCDECEKNFDGKTFANGLRDAARQSGQALAKDYFNLPKSLKKTTKHLGNSTTKVVLSLAAKCINWECDMIGQISQGWKPQNASEVKPQFIESLERAATDFGNKCATLFLITVRTGTQLAFVKIAMDEMGSQIDEVAGTLDELVSALPDPIGQYLKPGDICKNMVDKLVFKAAFFGVMKICKPTEETFYNVGGVRKTMLATPSKVDKEKADLQEQEDAAEAAAEDAEYNTTDDEAGDAVEAGQDADDIGAVGGEGDE